MFKFTFDEKEYILNDENFDTLINDDEKPVKDIDKNTILELLNNSLEEIDFSEEFYIEACTKCLISFLYLHKRWKICYKYNR